MSRKTTSTSAADGGARHTVQTRTTAELTVAPATDSATTVWHPDSLFQVDAAGIIRLFKPADFCPLPFSLPDAVGLSVKEVFPPTAAAVLLEGVATALATGEPQTVEFTVTAGSYEVRIAGGDEQTAWVVVRDISEWRRYEACDLLLLDIAAKVQQECSLEDILRFACERILQVFGAQLLGVARREDDGTLEFAAAGESKGIFADIVCLKDDNGLIGTALRTGRFQLMDISDPRMIALREGLKRLGVASAAAFPLKVGGLILGVLAIFAGDRDFWTKRTIVQLTNCAEQIAIAIYVTTNRQRLKLLTTGLESAANAVVISDRNGDIQWVNPAFRQLNGYGADEVMRGSVWLLGSARQTRGSYKAMRRHIAAGRIWHGEIAIRRKDGGEYTAELTVTPVRDEKGRIANYISVIQDISQRKKNEWEMAEARSALARAERLNALGTMAAGIAHEINQPLNALKVMADGMLYWHRKGRTADIDQAMDTVQEISREADRIDAIIKHMRSIIHRSQSSDEEACDLNQAVRASLSLLGAQLAAHNISVKTELAAELPTITGRGIQLEQIITNLVVNAMNALDAVEGDKEIAIATGCQREQVFLTVGDNGPGISQAIQDKIFEPFFTTKPEGVGMGLGLSVVHSIVSSYGGKIGVQDNKPAAGVTFRVEFPVVRPALKGDTGHEHSTC